MERLKAPFLGSFGNGPKAADGIAVRSSGLALDDESSPGPLALTQPFLCSQGVTAVKKEKQQGPLPRGVAQNHLAALPFLLCLCLSPERACSPLLRVLCRGRGDFGSRGPCQRECLLAPDRPLLL